MKRVAGSIKFLIIVILIFNLLNIAYAADKNPYEESLDFNRITEYFVQKISDSIEKEKIPGVSLAIVKGNQVFTKGFGFADIESNISVTADTNFKIASITKLFTTIGVMQLVEQGELDLNSDIRNFLEDFEYDNDYILTIGDLLTHISGFDESLINYQSLGFGSNYKLEDFVFRNQPDLIRMPGEFTQYNNYALSLAGYIIEETSSVDYKQYVKENIFTPLGMLDSSFNFENTVDSEIASEYIYQDNLIKAIYEYSLNAYPAGAITSSANDMTKFLLAMIEEGASENKNILKADTLKTMQSKQFSNHEELAGVCYGFIENIKNGHRFIGHGGSLMGVRSELLIDLENQLGIFVVANSNNSNEVTIELIESFIEEFYPFESNNYEKKEINNSDIDGKYYSNRFSRNTIEKIQLLIAPQIVVKSLDKTKIEVSGLGPTKEYQHLGDFLFIDESTGRKIAFELRNGEVYLYPFLPDWTLTKFSLLQDPLLHLVALGISLIVFFVNIISFFINRFVKNKKTEKIKILSVLGSVVNISFVILIIYQLVNMTDITEIGFGVASSLKALLILPLFSIVLLSAQFIFLVKIIIKKDLPNKKLIFNLMTIISSFVFIAILNFYNLIGFKF